MCCHLSSTLPRPHPPDSCSSIPTFSDRKDVQNSEQEEPLPLLHHWNLLLNRSAKEIDKMSTNTVSEYFLTQSVIRVLGSYGLNILSVGTICSNYCPFSEGGDIAILSFNNSAVIATQQSKEISADGEVKVSFDMEFERRNQNLVKQLIANMMVVAAMSLEQVCSERVQSEIKSISTYGLAADLILPLQLFKLTIDFDRNCVVIINKQNVELSADRFLDFDKLLTFMIRNCVHTF